MELVEFQPSKLDEKSEILLSEQLRLWIDSVVDMMDSELTWTNEPAIQEEN